MNKWYEQSGCENDVVISTRIRLVRNLRGIPFPVKMSLPDRRKLLPRVVAAAMANNTPVPHFHFINMEDLSKSEAVSLVERHLVSPEFISECTGRGLLVTDDEAHSILLNAEDHLHIQLMVGGFDLQAAYHAADELDTALDQTLHFAFDENLGYLTQNPVNLGTGMRASLMLHLPALKEGGGMARLASNLSKLGLALRSVYGSGSESKGAIYQLSNQVTLGLSEQEAIANLESIAKQIIGQERAARQELAENLDVQDVVSRSLGIFSSALMMTNDEFMRLISNVRLGVSIGLVENVSYDEINRLIIEMQPATLMLSSSKKLTASERHILRAKKAGEVFKVE